VRDAKPILVNPGANDPSPFQTSPTPGSSPVPAPMASPAVTAPSAPAAEPPPIPVYQVTSDADLWARIRRNFQMPDLQDSIVTQQEQWYSTRPDYIERMTGRSSKYLYHIVEELERRKMPSELALLPFIESAFNPQAVSSAKAAGMWQFIPSTGKDFRLKQNVFRDDRRDVLQSTRAALDYLQRLHGMFGDWHLALAAYNWGEGSVQRAQKRNQATGLGTGYLDLNMPIETRQYVPKLQAVKNIVANPAVFNAQLPEIPNHPYFKSVPLTRDMDVQLAAKLAEVKLDDFKQLNPSANKPVLFAAGTRNLLLPWDNAGIFERNLAIHNGQTAGWTVWTAPTTMRAAEAAQRVGMSEAQFREVNRIPPRMLVKAGSTLLAPRSSRQQSDVSEYVADNGQISLAPEIVTRRASVKARKGDSVASIARRYRLPPTQVAQWNRLSASSAFRPGQSVVLYLPIQARASAKGKALARGPAPQAVVAKGVKPAKASPVTRAQAKPAAKAVAKAPVRAAAKTPVKAAAKAPAKKSR
jgi:membrane-bound lytic murein transglycosylase D